MILGLESSCDETAVAILRGGDSHSNPELLASEVASQIAEHEKFGGVVPEVASRNHLAQLPRLLERAMASAKITINEIDAFAATSGCTSTAIAVAIGIGAVNLARGYKVTATFDRKRQSSMVLSV